MESIREVTEALTARSQTRSIDELQERGRKRVKVIRAEHIAAMIEESVQRAIAGSGLIPRDEADGLVERSRAEFASVHAERQREAQQLVEARSDLEEATHRREVLEQQVASLEDDLVEAEREVQRISERAAALEQELEAARATPAAAASSGPASETMLRMMEELATLKARMEVGSPSAAAPAAGPAPVPASAAPDGSPADVLTSALEKLTSSMNDRLEQMGRKMGISNAVEADAVKLDSVFSDLADQHVESNLDTMEVKQRQTGGIAANLARLKKLKGGD